MAGAEEVEGLGECEVRINVEGGRRNIRMQLLNMAYRAVLAVVHLPTQTTRERLDTHVAYYMTQQFRPLCETRVAVDAFVGAMRCLHVPIQLTKAP